MKDEQVDPPREAFAANLVGPMKAVLDTPTEDGENGPADRGQYPVDEGTRDSGHVTKNGTQETMDKAQRTGDRRRRTG